MSTIYIPTPLRRLTIGQSKVTLEGESVGAILTALDAAYPGIGERLFDEQGQVKPFINVFVNEDDMRTLQGLDTPVHPSDRISIVPAMAGGGQ
ncbi:MAG: MoaD/ThiS family protein [Caldilineales bacterium]|nr:MoaD/ThiS family protein [Caldilineales bacterium]